jgi:glutamyl/glutaminyl-tRNA synthetase
MKKYQIKPDHVFDINDFKNAFVNFVVAKQNNDNLIFIIDDYDVESLLKAQEKDIIAILKKFGIEFYQTIYSSENLSFHQSFGMQLTAKGHTYSCFCKEKKEPYDGKCLKLTDYEVLDNQTISQIRIKKPNSVKINDDFVILDFKKYPTTIFATAINDMLYNIDFQTYEKNQKSDTYKKDFLFESMNYKMETEFLEVPTIYNAISIIELFEKNILPDSIGFYVASKVFNLKISNDKVYTIIELLDFINIKDINHNDFKFNIDELIDVNNKMKNKVIS